MTKILEMLAEPNALSAAVRLTLAVICGGIIGLDRGRRNRPAGFRTHILVCMGAALTMLTGQYLATLLIDNIIPGTTTDVCRLGAQVINGIGFIGAGTIIVTNRQEIKGLTTAAGLWASACMGLAIGAGFYLGAILGCVLIFCIITFMRAFEGVIMSSARNINIYIELSDLDDIGAVIDLVKKAGIRIYDIDINKDEKSDSVYASAILSMRLPKKQPHSEIMASLAGIKTIRALEEI